MGECWHTMNSKKTRWEIGPDVGTMYCKFMNWYAVSINQHTKVDHGFSEVCKVVINSLQSDHKCPGRGRHPKFCISELPSIRINARINDNYACQCQDNLTHSDHLRNQLSDHPPKEVSVRYSKRNAVGDTSRKAPAEMFWNRGDESRKRYSTVYFTGLRIYDERWAGWAPSLSA